MRSTVMVGGLRAHDPIVYRAVGENRWTNQIAILQTL